MLNVSDFTQKFEFDLIVTHRPGDEWDDEEDPDGYVLRGDSVSAENASGGENDGAADANGAVAEDVDDCLIVDDEDEIKAATATAGTKRKRDDDDADGGGDRGDAKEIRIE